MDPLDRFNLVWENVVSVDATADVPHVDVPAHRLSDFKIVRRAKIKTKDLNPLFVIGMMLEKGELPRNQG